MSDVNYKHQSKDVAGPQTWMQEGTPWCSQHLLKMLYSLCIAQVAEGAQFWLAPSPEQAGFSVCGCRWTCSPRRRLCLSVCGVWALPLQAPGTRAEKREDRRQRPAGLMLWRLLFQSHSHTALADPVLWMRSPCYSTNIFPFLSVFPSIRLWLSSFISPSLYLKFFHNNLPLSDISLS